MKENTQKRIDLLVQAREYSEKMASGSVFVTDFQAMRLINRLIDEMQEMLAENLKLKMELKSEKTFKKLKKERPK